MKEAAPSARCCPALHAVTLRHSTQIFGYEKWGAPNLVLGRCPSFRVRVNTGYATDEISVNVYHKCAPCFYRDFPLPARASEATFAATMIRLIHIRCSAWITGEKRRDKPARCNECKSQTVKA